MKRIITKSLPLCFFLVLAACAQHKTVNGQSKVPVKAQKLFTEAYNAFQYGEYSKAEELFLQALKKAPNYVDAYDALGKTYQVQRKFRKAISSYRSVLSLDPSHLFAKYELGNIYFELSDLDSSKYFYNYFITEAGSDDRLTDHARTRLDNIAFINYSMEHPYNIQAVNLGSKVNSNREEYSPALTIDGKTLYFTWRDGSLDYNRQNEDIYYSDLTESGWAEAKALGPPINTIENEGAFSVSADGRYIFFTACNRSGGVGQCDIWLTMNEGTAWSDPLNLGKPINSRSWESQPSISSDGKYLYFTSNRAGGYGGTDLYVSTFTDSGWSSPQNLGPNINTSKDEQFPFIHSDGTTLYFGSDGQLGMGGFDIFVTHLKPDGSWAKPKNLGYPINSKGDDWNLIVSRNGVKAFFSTDRYEQGFGGMDIYSFDLPKEFQAQKVNYLKGIVIDSETKHRIGATVELIPLSGERSTNTFAPEKTGEFLVALRGNLRYALNVEKPGYLFYSDYFDMPENNGSEPFVINIPLQKIKVGSGIVLHNVFFDTDKAILKEESSVELEKLVLFLSKNKSIKIEISGHTDNTGSQSRNAILSQERADAVKAYLVSKGISPERLIAKGYGATRPIADNSTEKGRAENRRTEFKVL
ncbi:MAG: PD40 domain-containing protein [Bacteroidia bacterium]